MNVILFLNRHHYIVFQKHPFLLPIMTFFFHVVISIDLHHCRLLVKFPQNILLMITINQQVVFVLPYQQNSIFLQSTLKLLSKNQHNL